MNADRHQRLTDLFLQVVELDPAARAAFIQESTAGDDALRTELESLLAADAANQETREVGAGFLDQSALSGSAPIPEALGPFRIHRLLGEGGMGVVYEAEEGSPPRRVALKVIRGAGFSPHLRQRFAFEQAALARLQHPGIATIYQAGVLEAGGGGTGGEVPYFAMELVVGDPITTAANRRGLGIRERVELLTRVADAVHHAHTRGVIHRDLKPGNVLVVEVDGGLQPKVLDFGVARLTEDDVGQTIAGGFLGTLAYASPEQVDGRPVDITTDVYSLGALAYELLSGALPLELEGLPLTKAAEVIRTVEPRPLGSSGRRLGGDLATVVHKALAKDPLRRYPSAADFAADLRRVLAHEPVSAVPASALYLLGRFLRRRPGLVASLALIILSLSTALVLVSQANHRATRALEVQLAIEGYLSRHRLASQYGAVSLPQVRSAVRALDTERPIYREAEAVVRRRLARLLSSMGADGDAGVQFDRALALFEELYGDEDFSTATCRLDRARLWGILGRAEEGEQEARAAAGVLDRVAVPGAPDRYRAADAIGTLCRMQSKFDEAAEHFAVAAEGFARIGYRLQWLEARNNQAAVLALQGNLEAAEPLFAELLEAKRELHGEDSPTVQTSAYNLALARMELGRPEEALELARFVAGLREEALGAGHPRAKGALNLLARILGALDRREEQVALLRRVHDGVLEREGPAGKRSVDSLVRLAAALPTEDGQRLRAAYLERHGSELSEEQRQSLEAR